MARLNPPPSGQQIDWGKLRDWLYALFTFVVGTQKEADATNTVVNGMGPFGGDIKGFGMSSLATSGHDGVLTTYPPTSSTSGLWSVRGLTGVNNAGTPLSKFDFAAESVQVCNPSTNAINIIFNPGTITNDTGATGPALNARDQAGAFANSTWIHFYYIFGNGQTFGTISSVVAPTTGPTLPANYTSWAYIGAIFKNTGGALQSMYCRKDTFFYTSASAVLSSGAATTETSVSVSQIVPPNADYYSLNGTPNDLVAVSTAGGAIDVTAKLRVATGLDFSSHRWLAAINATTTNANPFPGATLPNVGQSFFYLLSITSGTSVSLSLSVTNYTISNGG